MDNNTRIQKIAELDRIFTETFNNSGNAYAILQLPIETPYKFRGYTDATTYLKREPNKTDYDVLWVDRCMSLDNPTTKEINEILSPYCILTEGFQGAIGKPLGRTRRCEILFYFELE